MKIESLTVHILPLYTRSFYKSTTHCKTKTYGMDNTGYRQLGQVPFPHNAQE
jgi:hypothetical protein